MDWNGGVVKPPSFEDEGALHVGKGRFLLSMSGDKGTKKVSSRTKVILSVIAVVVVLAALIITVLLAGHHPNSIPYKWNLSELLGTELETISSELKVPVSDWIQEGNGLFALKEHLEVSGISYKLLLNFDANAKLQGFEYIADYKADSAKAASDIYKATTDLRINGYGPSGTEEVELTASSLRRHFKQNKVLDVNASNGYARKSNEVNATEQYLKAVETDPSWPGLLHGYLVKPAILYQDIHVGYTPETESVLIHIVFKIEQQRENVN